MKKEFDIIDLVVIALAGSFLGGGLSYIFVGIESLNDSIWNIASGLILVVFIIVIRPTLERRYFKQNKE